MAERTLYDILEVSSTASYAAIRAAYERLSAELDPRRSNNAGNPAAAERYAAVEEAFCTLGAATKRQQYDRSLKGQPNVAAGRETRTLSADEYRQWVHDHVARGVIVKLGAILGVVGFGGMLAIVALIVNVGEKEIESKVGARVQAELKRDLDPVNNNLGVISTTLKENMGEFRKQVEGFMAQTRSSLTEDRAILRSEMSGKVAEALMNNAQLRDQLREKADQAIQEQGSQVSALAEKKVKDAVDLQVASPRFSEEAKRAVSAAFEGGPAALIEGKLRPILNDSAAPADHREQALRIMNFFVTNARTFRQDLLRIMKGTPASERDLRRLAVQIYRVCDRNAEPCAQSGEDAEALEAIINIVRRSANQFSIFGGSTASQMSEDEIRDYVRFFAKFRSEDAVPLLKMAREERIAPTAARIVADSLAAIGGDAAVDTLVVMAGRTETAAGSAAWQSLARLNPRDEVSVGSRQTAVYAILELAPRHVKAQGMAAGRHVEQLLRVLQTNDRETLLRLRNESQSLNIPSLEFAYRALIDAPSSSIAASIRRDPGFLKSAANVDSPERNQAIVSARVASLLRLDDWDGFLGQRIRASAGRTTEARYNADVLVSAWVRRLKMEHPKIEAAAKYVAELQAVVVELPDFLDCMGCSEALQLAIKLNGKEASGKLLSRVGYGLPPRASASLPGKRALVDALLVYAQEPGAQNNVREALSVVGRDKERAPAVAAVLADVASRSASRKQWHQAVQWYSEAIAILPAGEYFLRRSRSYLELDRKDDAAADLGEALKLKVRISTGDALEFVLRGDESSARKAVEGSVNEMDTREGQAGALENLGLYFVRTKQWQKAFAHTSEVFKISRDPSWNWAIRAIAARRLGLADEERVAREGWDSRKRPADLASLSRYIKDELQPFLTEPTR